jgi:hypothetical protein
MNGVPIDPSLESLDDLARPEDLEGVEVYRSLAEVPYSVPGATPCGAVFLWGRRGGPTGKPSSLVRALVGGGLGLVFIFVMIFK